MGNSGTFKPGDGRKRKPHGAKNKVTQSMRQAWLEAFEGVGGVPALIEWGKETKNRTAFYTLASKLIPIDIMSSEGLTINVNKRTDAGNAGS